MDKSPEAFRTITEVSRWLGTPAHVLRFWESRFPEVTPVKRAGGRRYYRPEDMRVLGGIKTMLHDQGKSIRDVQDLLASEGTRAITALSPDLTFAEPGERDDAETGRAGSRLRLDLPPEAAIDAPPPTADTIPDARSQQPVEETPSQPLMDQPAPGPQMPPMDQPTGTDAPGLSAQDATADPTDAPASPPSMFQSRRDRPTDPAERTDDRIQPGLPDDDGGSRPALDRDDPQSDPGLPAAATDETPAVPPVAPTEPSDDHPLPIAAHNTRPTIQPLPKDPPDMPLTWPAIPPLSAELRCLTRAELIARIGTEELRAIAGRLGALDSRMTPLQ